MLQFPRQFHHKSFLRESNDNSTLECGTRKNKKIITDRQIQQNSIFVYDTQSVTRKMDIKITELNRFYKQTFHEILIFTYFFNSNAHLANRYLHCGDLDPFE